MLAQVVIMLKLVADPMLLLAPSGPSKHHFGSPETLSGFRQNHSQSTAVCGERTTFIVQ